jgi:hypothetical protein
MAFYTSVGWSTDRTFEDPMRNDFEAHRPSRRAERLETRSRLYGVPKIGEARHDYSSHSWYARYVVVFSPRTLILLTANTRILFSRIEIKEGLRGGTLTPASRLNLGL